MVLDSHAAQLDPAPLEARHRTTGSGVPRDARAPAATSEQKLLGNGSAAASDQLAPFRQLATKVRHGIKVLTLSRERLETSRNLP